MNGTSLAPSVLLSDYVKLGFLAVSLVLGLGANAACLYRLTAAYRRLRTTRTKNVKAAFTLLKIHLTLSNILVLLTYNTTHIAWLATYQWRGGDVLCRLSHFLFVFAFQSLSNIVAAIAVDRLRNALRIAALYKNTEFRTDTVLPFVKWLLVGAWVSAVVFSVPQLLLWGTEEVEVGWVQCMSVWDQQRLALIQSLEAQGQPDHVIQHAFDIKFGLETVYGAVHLVCVFWLPFLSSLLCYAVLSAILIKLSFADFRQRSSVTTSTLQDSSTLVVRRDVPHWRLRIRGRLLRTAGLIMLAYTVSWAPYNILSLVVMWKPGVSSVLTDNLDWVKALIILNALLNPLLYGSFS